MDKPKVKFENFNKPHWTEQEQENVDVMYEFFQKLIIQNDFNAFLERFEGSEYIQHNRIVETGIKPLLNFTKQLIKLSPQFYSELKHVYADGDMVVFRSHATLKAKHRGNDKKGLIIVDTWRLSDGKIDEHWDCIQPLSFSMRFFLLLGGGRVMNNNGIF